MIVRSSEEVIAAEEPIGMDTVIRFFWKNRWTLIIIAGIGFAISLVLTFFLTPTYRTTAVVFATQTNSSKSLLENQQFGFDIDADRLIQVLGSDYITDSVIKRFDLINHYEIDVNEPDWRDRLMLDYHSKISFSRTIYMSVVIGVVEEDSELGAEIANAIVDMVDHVRAVLLKQNSKKALDWVEAEYRDKLSQVLAARDSLAFARLSSQSEYKDLLNQKIKSSELRTHELYAALEKLKQNSEIQDIGSQLKLLNEALEKSRFQGAFLQGRLEVIGRDSKNDSLRMVLSADLKGEQLRALEIKKRIDILAPQANDFTFLENQINKENKATGQMDQEIRMLETQPGRAISDPALEFEQEAFDWDILLLNELKRNYERALSTYEDPLPATYKVNKAYPSYRKHSPVLWINVLIGTLFPLLFGIVLIVFIDRIKDIKKKYAEGTENT